MVGCSDNWWTTPGHFPFETGIFSSEAFTLWALRMKQRWASPEMQGIQQELPTPISHHVYVDCTGNTQILFASDSASCRRSTIAW